LQTLGDSPQLLCCRRSEVGFYLPEHRKSLPWALTALGGQLYSRWLVQCLELSVDSLARTKDIYPGFLSHPIFSLSLTTACSSWLCVGSSVHDSHAQSQMHLALGLIDRAGVCWLLFLCK
jgi:hypothetical protein